MAPIPKPQAGDAVATHPTYSLDMLARRFWRLSYRCGRHYINGKDAHGQPVLVEHEREEGVSYARRKRLCKPRNFVGPILRRYNDLVFRKDPVRPTDAVPPIYTETVEDATGTGEHLDTFVRRALLRAQIDREVWVLLDVANRTGDAMTVAQARAAGTRPVLRLLDTDEVVHWRETRGGEGGAVVAEAWVLMVVDGREVVRMFDARTYTDAVLAERDTDGDPDTLPRVAVVEPPVVHGYDGCPVLRLRPSFDPLGEVGGSEGDSQAGPLAESQQAIVNLVSLVNEEIANVTFSQMIAFGVSESQVGDVRVGNNRVLCIPNPAGSVSMIGADPAQATSIRAQILDETENLFRLAGVTPGDASATPASGVALAFRHNDLATIVAALALACEEVEAAVWHLLGGAWGFEPPADTVYQGKDVELPEYQTEAQTMATIVANSALPSVLRLKAAQRFASRNLSLEPDEERQLAEEITRGGALSRMLSGGAPFGGAFPPTLNDDEPDDGDP